MEVLHMTKQLDEAYPAEPILPPTDDAPVGALLAKPPSDRLLLGGASALLLGLAGVFGWRELQVDPAYLLTIAETLGLVASSVDKSKLATRGGLLTLLLCAALGGAFYAAVRSLALLPGLLMASAGGLLFLGRGYPRASYLRDRATVALGFGVLVATTLVASWACYFHFLTAGVAVDAVARRLVLTLLWVAAGVALVVFGGKRRELAMRTAGYVFVVAATGKALLYDTTHLGGGLRVLVLLAAGVCLLGGAALSARKERQ
jgi:hypothetical protein